MAGITAMIEIDIKKIIALSTLRQLGVMIIIFRNRKSYIVIFSFNLPCFF